MTPPLSEQPVREARREQARQALELACAYRDAGRHNDAVGVIAALTPQPSGEDAVREAAKPWADYHGDLPDYDHPLRPVFESGIQYAVELLAKQLGVADWTPCDGTEEFDGDLGGTLMNIVLAAMPEDAHGDPIWPRDLPAALSTPPTIAESAVPAGNTVVVRGRRLPLDSLSELERLVRGGARIEAISFSASPNPDDDGMGVRSCNCAGRFYGEPGEHQPTCAALTESKDQ